MVSVPAVMMKNVTIQAGTCRHRRCIRQLLPLVSNGPVDPATLLTKREPVIEVLGTEGEFQARNRGRLKMARHV